MAAALAVVLPPGVGQAGPKVCGTCIKGNMERLAAPAMRGRACGTADENAAASFIAERLKAYGVSGGAAGGEYLQRVEIRSPTYAAAPVLQAGGLRLNQGREMLAIDPPEVLEGVLTLHGAGAPPTVAGAVVVYEAPAPILAVWDQLAERPPRGTEIAGVESPPQQRPLPSAIYLRPEAFAALKASGATEARLTAPRGPAVTRTSYNVLGVIRGRAKDAEAQSILLSAHYDHVGVRGGVIYPGANDDASGTAAVMEFARLLADGKRPKRTVHFALFGCEEEGGHGAKYWIAHPPAPLAHVAANLEFEMIAAPDPQDRRALMLTGWERSNLGPVLRAQGASLVPDRYPEQNFFQRSDNYQLALKGVVAQTISAWPLTPTYHRPTDDLAHLDMPFMIEVIQSLARPIKWLANSGFRPEWEPGMRP